MIQIPENFERSLRNYDERLRLRFGPYIKQWIIERIGRVSEGEARLLRFAASRPDADPKAQEEWDSARNGRHVIHYAKYLDQRIHDFLWEHDIQRHGFKILTRFLRTQERKKKAKQEQGRDLLREMVTVMGHLNRKKGNAIHHGKADSLVREAFHMDALPEQKKAAQFDPKRPPSPLVDQFGRDLKPRVETKKIYSVVR